MNEINIDSNNIIKISDKLIDYSDQFETEINRFLSNINKISFVWQGTDASTYLDKIINDYIPILKKLAIVVKEKGEFLKEVDEYYKNLDEKYSSQSIDF